jgi:hypothetical protein
MAILAHHTTDDTTTHRYSLLPPQCPCGQSSLPGPDLPVFTAFEPPWCDNVHFKELIGFQKCLGPGTSIQLDLLTLDADKRVRAFKASKHLSVTGNWSRTIPTVIDWGNLLNLCLLCHIRLYRPRPGRVSDKFHYLCPAPKVRTSG